MDQVNFWSCFIIIILLRINTVDSEDNKDSQNYKNPDLTNKESVENSKTKGKKTYIVIIDDDYDVGNKEISYLNNNQESIDIDEIKQNELDEQLKEDILRLGFLESLTSTDQSKDEMLQEIDINEKDLTVLENIKLQLRQSIVQKQHEQKLREIENFIKDRDKVAKFVRYEVNRIQKTREIIDPLREMVKTLEDPKYVKAKKSVLDCFKRFFNSIKPNVDIFKHPTNQITIWNTWDDSYS